MSVKSAWSNESNTQDGFQVAYDMLCRRMQGCPDYIYLAYAKAHQPQDLLKSLRQVPAATRIFAASTNNGVMTEGGVYTGPNVIGMLGFRKPGTSFGVAAKPKGDDPRAAARDAVHAALRDVARSGEMPDLVIVAQTPGDEESVLAGISDVLGPSALVFGGGACGNFREKTWSVIGRKESFDEGVAITVVFGGIENSLTFQGGCVPSEFSGTVTEVDGPRVIRKIDGLPAFDVYQNWHMQALGKPVLVDEKLRLSVMLAPLGRRIGEMKDLELFAITSLGNVDSSGSIEVLTDVALNQVVHFMVGTKDTLIVRPARAINAAIDMQKARSCSVDGALIAYCAGLARLLEDDMHKVHRNICTAMTGRPFLAAFTFGEQGVVEESYSVYGNLMVSTLVLGSEEHHHAK